MNLTLFLTILSVLGYSLANSHEEVAPIPAQFIPSLGDTSPGSVWPQPQTMNPTTVVSYRAYAIGYTKNILTF